MNTKVHMSTSDVYTSDIYYKRECFISKSLPIGVIRLSSGCRYRRNTHRDMVVRLFTIGLLIRATSY